MNVVIVEDERIAARRLERLVREILGERLREVVCFESLRLARRHVEEHRIDVLLLDLNLNGANGFELLRQALVHPFQTIVVSANTDKALLAFEYGVLDFIPKPFDRERLAKALNRIDRRERSGARSCATQLAIKRYGSLFLVPVEEVLYFQGAGDYVEIHTRKGETELHSKSLESLEHLLPQHFVRVHKSYLVDVRAVKEIRVHGGGKYELDLGGGVLIPLARSKYRDVQERLGALL